MAKGPNEASRAEPASDRRSRPPATSAAARRALELVAVRGKDVIGVRHMLAEGRAHIGDTPSSIARVPLAELDRAAPVIAEVIGARYVLHVPRRTRARVHGADGLGRLLTGPVDIELQEGDRAVLVIGPVQIRAQIVPIEIIARLGASSLRWIGLIGALYITALAICAVLAPRDRARLDEGSIRRAVSAAAAQLWAEPAPPR
ncbi:hypothetical protein [Sorangium cellulosum]|uniref:Uncharacterized protein n=1 Tax=Sorangium cellulosum TaxID=56 RepID=A0A150QYA9_SORCE|nr:hypothetical protein [Sorangium cellulosum]KYF72628.1 hypothetical protein BE15_29535 [Sorangium cellulosum]